MLYCLAVRLARKPQTAVSDFCDLDDTDQFWLDPPSEDDAELDSDHVASTCETESSTQRVLWFRFRRIAYLRKH
jgi:hypothetical protein